MKKYDKPISEQGDEFVKPFIQNGIVALPHSCDEWVIGDKEDVKQMIKWLQELLQELDKTTNAT